MSDEQLAKEQFKQMGLKQKIDHIWEYYKIHIIGTIILILLAFSVINATIINPTPKNYTGVAFYGIHVDDNKLKYLSQTLTELLVSPEEHKELKFHTFYEMEDDSMMAVEQSQKFETLNLAKEIDVIIAPEEKFSTLVDEGYIVNLDEYLDNNTISNYQAKNRIYEGTNQQDSTVRPYGISVTDASAILIVPEVTDPDNTYIGFMRHTTRPENAVKTVNQLLSTDTNQIASVTQ